MNRENQFLFLAGRQVLSQEKIDTLLSIVDQEGFNWDQMFAKAEQNGIAGLIYHHVESNPSLAKLTPKNILSQYKLHTLRLALFKEQRSKQITNMLRFFSHKNIQVMLIKGAALDVLVYKHPWFTSSNDIDIILNVKPENITHDQKQEIGSEFHRKGIEFDYFSHHDMNMNGMLPIDFSSIWQDARNLVYHGEGALVLSDEDMLISVCINSCRKRYSNLKSFVDIAEIIEKFPDLNWNRFVDLCKKYKCQNIIYTAFIIANKTVGCSVPARIIQLLEPDPVKKFLIRSTTNFLVNGTNYLKIKPDTSSFGKYIDPSLLLTYTTYTPMQVLSKFFLNFNKVVFCTC